MSRRRLASLGALVGLVLAAWPAWRFLRAAAMERAAYEPRRGPVAFAPDAPPSQRVRFGDDVRGSWVAPKNGAAVILAHGSGADRTQLADEVSFLARAGFGVLAFDWPGHGESGGEVRLGRPELDAMRAAVDFTAAQDGVQNARIGVLGVSMGASLAILAGASDVRIRAVLAAGAFTDAAEQTRDEYRAHGWFAQQGALWVLRTRMEGGNLRPIDRAAALRGRRTLFVVCEDDAVVPPRMGEALAREAGGELWRRPACGHGEWRVDRTEGGAAGGAWEARVTAFFAEALTPP